MPTYKYALSITSQAPFCSVPIRLDSYSGCQFGCAYCFAKARGGSRGSRSLSSASPTAIRARFTRVSRGDIRSSLDEMLARRVPIQFGGMTDPFSGFEAEQRITLDLLRILSDFDYPTLLSTKGILFSASPYFDVIREGNFLVRCSFAGVDQSLEQIIEGGVSSRDERFRAIERVSTAGVPVSIRLQPIFPGYEAQTLLLISKLSSIGVKHVSAEFLKLPVERTSHQALQLERVLPGLFDHYHRDKARRSGREFVLKPSVKLEPMLAFEKQTVQKGMLFGFAENEFLHLNPYISCCNAADRFLRNANFFHSNILTAVKKGFTKNQITLQHILNEWRPKFSLTNYFNSNSRPKTQTSFFYGGEWIDYLTQKWNSHEDRGGPGSFWGCIPTEQFDDFGNKVYSFSNELLALIERRKLIQADVQPLKN